MEIKHNAYHTARETTARFGEPRGLHEEPAEHPDGQLGMHMQRQQDDFLKQQSAFIMHAAGAASRLPKSS